MKSQVFKTTVFVYASAALLATSVTAQASDDSEYCSEKLEEVEQKQTLFEAMFSEFTIDGGALTDTERSQLLAREALYKQSLSEWTFDCECKSANDDDCDISDNS